MKKRLLSLVLALVLVLGAALAPSFGSDAASKTKYTKLTLNNTDVDVEFFVLEEKRDLAATNLEKTLNAILKKNSSFTVTVEIKGEKQTFTAKKTGKQGKGSIKVDGKKLSTFIKDNAGNDTSVIVSVNLKKALGLVKMAKKSAAYGFREEIKSVEFKELKISKKNKLTFKGNGKKMTAYIKGGAIYLKGDQRKSKFVKNLKKEGVVKKAKVVKVKTSSLSK